eukprot:9794033-Karenia_brevis.AAC.1
MSFIDRPVTTVEKGYGHCQAMIPFTAHDYPTNASEGLGGAQRVRAGNFWMGESIFPTIPP